jgi:hypothetical protein
MMNRSLASILEDEPARRMVHQLAAASGDPHMPFDLPGHSPAADPHGDEGRARLNTDALEAQAKFE